MWPPTVFQYDGVILPKFPVTGHQGVYHDETETPRRIILACCPIRYGRYGGLVHHIHHNLVDHTGTYIIYHGLSHVYPISFHASDCRCRSSAINKPSNKPIVTLFEEVILNQMVFQQLTTRVNFWINIILFLFEPFCLDFY